MGIEVRQSVTIDRPAGELYRYWRKLEQLPSIMRHLESVEVIDDRRSHWVAKGIGDASIEWDAEITGDEPGERIYWHSVRGAEVPNHGHVSFTKAPPGLGTEVRVALAYYPPGGKLASAFAKLFGEEPSQQVREDLKRFKQLMETGEVATIEGQPAGGGR